MRRSLVLLSSLVLAFTFAACGDDASSDDGAASSMDDHAMNDDAMSHGGEGGGHSEASPVAPGARRVDVVAGSLAFAPTEIQVAAGENIAIALTSEDELHDFTIDELEAHVSADAGETAEGGFQAAQPGRYSFYCSVETHREGGMEGTIVVT